MTGSLVGRRLVLLVADAPRRGDARLRVPAPRTGRPGGRSCSARRRRRPDVAALRRGPWAYDRPLPAQYARLPRARRTRGDLGAVDRVSAPPFTRAVAGRYPATLELGGRKRSSSRLGLGPAPRPSPPRSGPGSAVDRTTRLASLAGACLPGFLARPAADPASSRCGSGGSRSRARGGLAHLVLPATTLGLGMSAILVRARAQTSMIVALGEDYVRSARAKGAPEWAR